MKNLSNDIKILPITSVIDFENISTKKKKNFRSDNFYFTTIFFTHKNVLKPTKTTGMDR